MEINVVISIIQLLLMINGYPHNSTEENNYLKEVENINIIDESGIYLNENIELEKIRDSVEDILGDHINNVGVYYYNLATGETYTINEDIYFISASLKKVPQVMMILDQIRDGELALDKVIHYRNEDFARGTGILQNEKYIRPITIKKAIELSIIYSDNIAFNMLKRVSGKDVNQYIKEICEENHKPESNTTTAYQQFKIYERLYNYKKIDSNYKMLEELLKNTVFHDRLDKYIPRELVAHKIGNFYRYYNDAGIIYLQEPYILVVLTKDIGRLSKSSPPSGDENERCLVDFGEEASDLIARISKSIYDILNEK